MIPRTRHRLTSNAPEMDVQQIEKKAAAGVKNLRMKNRSKKVDFDRRAKLALGKGNSRRKPLQQLVNNTPTKKSKVIASKTIPAASTAKTTAQERNLPFKIFKQENLSVYEENQPQGPSMLSMLTSIRATVKGIRKKDLEVHLSRNGSAKLGRDTIVQVLDMRCERIRAKGHGEVPGKHRRKYKSINSEQALVAEYLVQEVLLAVLLETKQLSLHSNQTDKTSVNTLLVQASNDRTLILQKLKSKYDFKDWAFVNVLKNTVATRHLLNTASTAGVEEKHPQDDVENGDSVKARSTYNTHKLLKKIKALEVRNENREKYALMQVQKLLEDNKSLQAAKDASDKQLSASYNDLSNEKMKCRKLEVQLAESAMASNQLKHKFENFKSLHDSQTNVAMKAEAKAQQQSALVAKLREKLQHLESNFDMAQRFSKNIKFKNQVSDLHMKKRLYTMQNKAQNYTLSKLQNDFRKLEAKFIEERKTNTMLSETYESLQNEFELYRSSMEARIMKLSEKANRISKDKETYETTLEQLEHKYVDSVDIMKNTSKECLHLTNETNRLKEELANALLEKRNVEALNAAHENQIERLEDMKNKAIADKHLIEKILNKEITSLRNNKKDLVAHFRSVEEELRYELKTKTLLVSKLEDEIDFSNKYIEGFDHTSKAPRHNAEISWSKEKEALLDENARLSRELSTLKTSMEKHVSDAQAKMNALMADNAALTEDIVNLADQASRANVGMVEQHTETIHIANNDQCTQVAIEAPGESNAYKEMKKLFDACEVELRKVQNELQNSMGENAALKARIKAMDSQQCPILLDSATNTSPGSPAELPNCGAKDAYEHTGDNKETVGRMEEEVKMLREKMESIRGVIYEKDSQITDLSAENVSLNKEIEAIKSKWYDDLADAKKLEETLASAVPSTTAQEEIKKLEENYAVVLKNAKEAEQRESVLASENTALKEKISHVVANCNTANSKLEAITLETKALTAKYEEATKALEARNTDLRQLASDLDREKKVTETLKNEIDAKDVNLKQTSLKADKCVEDLKKQLEKESQRVKDLQRQVSESTTTRTNVASEDGHILQQKYDELKIELQSTVSMYNTTIQKLNTQLEEKSKCCDDLKKMVKVSITKVKNDLDEKASLIQNLTTKIKKRDAQIAKLKDAVQENEEVCAKLKSARIEDEHRYEAKLGAIKNNADTIQELALQKLRDATNEKLERKDMLCNDLESKLKQVNLEYFKSYNTLKAKFVETTQLCKDLESQNTASISTLEILKAEREESSKKYADMQLAYMKMVDQVKMMENDGVLMEESLKSSNGDKVRMYIEQINMLQEETNEYRHRLLVQDAKHIAFVEKSAEDKDKVLHENALQYQEEMENLATRHVVKVKAYTQELALYKNTVEEQTIELQRLREDIGALKSQPATEVPKSSVKTQTSNIKPALCNIEAQTVTPDKYTIESQTVPIDFSHAKSQTVHVAVCEGVTQTVTGVFADREVQTDKPAVRELLVQTDALKRSDRFTQANDTTTEKYIHALEKQVVDEKKSTAYFRTALQSQKELLESKENKITQLMSQGEQLSNETTSAAFELESEIARLKKELSHSKQHVKKLKDEYKLTESLLQKTQEELATKSDQYDYQLKLRDQKAGTDAADEEVSNISIGYIGADQLVRAQTPPHQIGIRSRDKMSNAMESPPSGSKKKRRNSEPMDMFGSPKSKTSPFKSLDDSTDSVTREELSKDDSFTKLTPYGAYTPLAVKIQRYAAELSGKLKDELEITIDDTLDGTLDASSNLGGSNISVKSSGTLLKNIEQAMDDSALSSSNGSSIAGNNSLLIKATHVDGTPMIPADLLHSANSSKSTGSSCKHKRRPRSLDDALGDIAEKDLRHNVEQENSRLKFYNQVLAKGIRRLSIGED